jgi:hypothetical protein
MPVGHRIPVDSSVLASVLYLPKQRLLEVEFRSGHCHQYSDLPQQLYDELLNAESKGAYFNTNIRNCFPSRQLERHRAAGREDSTKI